MSARVFLVLLFFIVPPCSALDTQFSGEGGIICQAAVNSYKQGAWADAAQSWERCYVLALTLIARASIATDLGITLHKLGREEQAAPWLRRAVGTWPSVPGSGESLARATLWLVEAERTLGHFGVVEDILRNAIAAHPSAALEAELHGRLATIMREMGRPEESRIEFQAVLDLPGSTVAQRIDALVGQAEIERHNMRYRESIERLDQALRMSLEMNDSRAQSDVLQGLGLAWMSMGDLSRAEVDLNRSLALAETGAGSTPQRIGTALQCLAALHGRNQKYSMAEDELRRALVLLGTTLRDGHPQIAAVMGDLAEVYRNEKRFTEALQYAGQAYAAMRRSLGDDSVGAAEELGLTARIEADRNNTVQAADDYARAIAILRHKGANHDVRLVGLMNDYAALLVSMHRGQEAKQVQAQLKTFR